MSTEHNKNNNKNINNLFNTFKSIMKSKYNTFKLLSFKNFLEKKIGNIGNTSNYKKDILDIVCEKKNELFTSTEGNLNKTTMKLIIREILNKITINGTTNNNKTIGIVLGEIEKKNKKKNEKIILLCKNDINHIIKTIEFLLENISINATGYCGSIKDTKINLGNHFCLTVPNVSNEIIIRSSDTSSVKILTHNGGRYKAMGGKIQYGGELVIIILFVAISLFFGLMGLLNPVED
jgi:hypothetical protein